MRGINAAGIDNMECTPIPFGFCEEAITCGAGRIVHNCKTFADQTIE
jgi:hypothetical protein